MYSNRSFTSFHLMVISVVTLLGASLVSHLYASGVTLTVETNAPGAAVFVDGNPIEMGPESKQATREATPYGLRVVNVRHPGFEPFEQSLSVGLLSLAPKVVAQLKPIPVTLTIQTEPGAEVSIDGQSVGSVGSDRSLRKSDLAAGPHTVKVKARGYLDWSHTFTLSPPGQSVSPDLQPTAEKLQEAEANRSRFFHTYSEARRYFASRNYAAAMQAAELALSLDPSNAEARSLRNQIDETIKILGNR